MPRVTIMEISIIMECSYNTSCLFIKKHNDFPEVKDKKLNGSKYSNVYDEDEVKAYLLKVNYSSDKGKPLKEDTRKYIPDKHNIKAPTLKYQADFTPIEVMRLKQWGIKYQCLNQ